ncbi:unnamed protein product [Clavelina lepadiformis]|uniref:Uncharacterized protein n=1 Tax=Clavelina lepadiformis TaxID=159417 RepID=A0ABP0GSN1_CLALP
MLTAAPGYPRGKYRSRHVSRALKGPTQKNFFILRGWEDRPPPTFEQEDAGEQIREMNTVIDCKVFH